MVFFFSLSHCKNVLAWNNQLSRVGFKRKLEWFIREPDKCLRDSNSSLISVLDLLLLLPHVRGCTHLFLMDIIMRTIRGKWSFLHNFLWKKNYSNHDDVTLFGVCFLYLEKICRPGHLCCTTVLLLLLRFWILPICHTEILITSWFIVLLCHLLSKQGQNKMSV